LFNTWFGVNSIFSWFRLGSFDSDFPTCLIYIFQWNLNFSNFSDVLKKRYFKTALISLLKLDNWTKRKKNSLGTKIIDIETNNKDVKYVLQILKENEIYLWHYKILQSNMIDHFIFFGVATKKESNSLPCDICWLRLIF
jgi:hypothetical protein